MRHTHSRSQRFGGHTKHTRYCSCGKQVVGNGGKRHFELDGHDRILYSQWSERFGAASNPASSPTYHVPEEHGRFPAVGMTAPDPASRPPADATPFEKPKMQQIGESLPASEPEAS